MNHVVDIGDNYYCCSGTWDLKMKGKYKER